MVEKAVELIKKHKKLLLIIFLILICIGIILYYQSKPKFIVRGNSMAPCLKHETSIAPSFFENKTKMIDRDDLVIFNWKEKQLVKRVIGIPGDQFKLVKNNSQNCFNILINDKVANTLSGRAYCMTRRTLQVFADSYVKGIPENNYLVMGEVIPGSEDSSLFGLVDGKSIFAKISGPGYCQN